jgi:hypothetical protein
MSDNNDSTPKPHDHFKELTPAQREEWAKMSADAAEVKRLEDIGKAQWTFDKVAKANLTISNGNGNGKEKQKEKNVHFVQKHSEPGLLAEAVIVGGIPYFAVSRSSSKEITLEPSIAIDDKSEYKPFEPAAYLNEPYSFKSKKEFESCVQNARGETLDSLYKKKVKPIWSKYIDADDFHISICAADTIGTYYQDKLGMTHYLFFVGGNDSGKSNNLLVLKHLAYRNFTSTGMTVANVYQFLGSDEEGQGTLCYDEADKIDEDRSMMAVLKNGYIKGFPVPRIDTSFGRKQLKFNTYGFKAFAAERFLDPINAKGLIQRTIELQCYVGDPKYDIAEVTDSTNADEFQELNEELSEIRNILLIVRLLHFHEKIPDVKLNIKRREKQLFKPIIRIFQNAATLDELLPVINKYLTQRREANYSTLHAFLYRIIRDIIKSRGTSRIESGFIWDFIKSTLQGADIPGKALSYDSSEFGTITQKDIIQTLEHVFGAKPKKSHGIRFLDFDISKLQRLGKAYDLAIGVKVVRDGDDSFEENRGSDWTDWTDVGLVKHMSENTDEHELISEPKLNEHENPPKETPTHPTDPPQATHPTPTVDHERIRLVLEEAKRDAAKLDGSEEEREAMIKKYERLSAQARKKSKEAAHVGAGTGDNKT